MLIIPQIRCDCGNSCPISDNMCGACGLVFQNLEAKKKMLCPECHLPKKISVETGTDGKPIIKPLPLCVYCHFVF